MRTHLSECFRLNAYPQVPDFTRVNNEKDMVPTVPGRFLGFHHPSGEVHVQDSNAWDNCPGASFHPRMSLVAHEWFTVISCTGQDNTSTPCIVGAVPNIFDGSTSNHDGPYDSIMMGC